MLVVKERIRRFMVVFTFSCLSGNRNNNKEILFMWFYCFRIAFGKYECTRLFASLEKIEYKISSNFWNS